MTHVRDLECPLCHVRDIPYKVHETWLWWHDSRPIHPQCDREMWECVSPKGKRAVAEMVRKLLRDAGC